MATQTFSNGTLKLFYSNTAIAVLHHRPFLFGFILCVTFVTRWSCFLTVSVELYELMNFCANRKAWLMRFTPTFFPSLCACSILCKYAAARESLLAIHLNKLMNFPSCESFPQKASISAAKNLAQWHTRLLFDCLHSMHFCFQLPFYWLFSHFSIGGPEFQLHDALLSTHGAGHHEHHYVSHWNRCLSTTLAHVVHWKQCKKDSRPCWHSCCNSATSAYRYMSSYPA